jgi:indole-3-glycerol phosphate synthase
MNAEAKSTRTAPEVQRMPLPATLPAILEETRRRLPALREQRRDLEDRAAATEAPPDWIGAFARGDVAVLAEIKRRSPSLGDIACGIDPAGHASAYEAGGARAISVLTNAAFFGGTLADLEAVRRSVRLPVLRKDFILDPVQVYEARAAGASAILLIVRALDAALLAELAALASEVGLGTLVEVHNRPDLDTALAIGSAVVGVNSRDLETFRVDLATVEGLLRHIPPHVVAVAESGIATRADVERVASWGADAVLVGAHLAGASNPRAAVRELAGIERRDRG